MCMGYKTLCICIGIGNDTIIIIIVIVIGGSVESKHNRIQIFIRDTELNLTTVCSYTQIDIVAVTVSSLALSPLIYIYTRGGSEK